MISVGEEEVDLIKQHWADFFSKYNYRTAINFLSTQYPDEKSLKVSFKDLYDFDSEVPSFSSNILQAPELYLGIGESLISENMPQKRAADSRRVNIRLTDLPEKGVTTEIRNIRSYHVGTLISVNGIIRKNTEVLPRLQNAAFECQVCGTINYVKQERGRQDEPVRCRNEECNLDRTKTRFKLLTGESEFVDVEKIEIQENPETLDGGAQPQRITVILEDDLTGRLFPGDRVIIDGTLKAEQKRAGTILLTEFSVYLYTINYRKEAKEVENIHITEEDEKTILELSKEPNIIEKFASSIAPTIFGLEMVKTSLVLQMFGGVRKTMRDGTTIRGDIHILMVGDPGTAKSQLLRYMTEISPRGVFAFGRGSSAAGLTAAAVRDDFGEGRWTLEAGALVLADNGFVAIDELDKMDDRDTAAMHEAMEQQTVTISKAGIMATLKSRCSILGAANPKFGRYDQNKTIVDQIDFPPPLLSRFDVIFKMIDIPERNNDSKLAEHILKAHRVGEIFRSLEQNELSDVEIPEEKGFKPPIEKEMIRKYVSYAKSRIFPRLSDEAITLLKDEYVNTRNTGTESIPITARQLESTIRLAEAAAKARLSAIVSYNDALLAKKIVDYYLRDVSTSNGELNIDILYTGMSSKQRNEAEKVLDIIKELKDEKKVADIEEVIKVAVSRGISKENVETAITKLKNQGQIYEPGYGKIGVIK
ncbi:MAG: ATPase [Thermoplasmatales archaeon B_DKE]|nr:MAG: ATPase [Thermoplasmatales archaeon B_DKE]